MVTITSIIGIIVVIGILRRFFGAEERSSRRPRRSRSRGMRRGAGMADVLGWTPTKQEVRDYLD